LNFIRGEDEDMRRNLVKNKTSKVS
jgi:hypothetical protein